MKSIMFCAMTSLFAFGACVDQSTDPSDESLSTAEQAVGTCSQVSPAYSGYLAAAGAAQYFNCGSSSKEVIGNTDGQYWISCCTRDAELMLEESQN